MVRFASWALVSLVDLGKVEWTLERRVVCLSLTCRIDVWALEWDVELELCLAWTRQYSLGGFWWKALMVLVTEADMEVAWLCQVATCLRLTWCLS